MSSRTRVGDILLKANVLDELQLRSARAHHEQWGGNLAKAIADMGFATEDQICDAVAASMHLNRVQVGLAKDPAAIAKLDEHFCEKNMVFPVQLKDNGKTLLLAMADPTDLDTADHASGLAHCRVIAAVASETEIMSAIRRCYRGEESHTQALPEHPALRADERELDLEESELEEGEVLRTDPHGRHSPFAAPIPASAMAPTPVPAFTPVPTPAPSPGPAGDILDEVLSGMPLSKGLTADELLRLEAVRANQHKSAKIVRAVIELLAEKGYTTPHELAARLKG